VQDDTSKMARHRDHLPALSYGRTLGEICCNIIGCPPIFDLHIALPTRSETVTAWATAKQTEKEAKAAGVIVAWETHAAAVNSVKKAEENAKSADVELQKLTKNATDQAYRPASDRERARIQAARAWAEVVERDKQVKIAAQASALHACKIAEVQARQAEVAATAASEIAELVLQTASYLTEALARIEAVKREREAVRQEARLRQEDEAKADAKRREQEESATAKQVAAEAEKAGAKRAEVTEKRKAKIESWVAPIMANRKARKQAQQSAKRDENRKARTLADQAAKEEQQKQEGLKVENDAIANAKKALSEAGASPDRAVSIAEFANAAKVPRRTALRILQSGLLKTAASDPQSIDHQDALQFLTRLVSVEEVLMHWPQGPEIAFALEEGKVPPALAPKKFGAVLYRRDYAMFVSDELS
jgi:hypothetical protein